MTGIHEQARAEAEKRYNWATMPGRDRGRAFIAGAEWAATRTRVVTKPVTPAKPAKSIAQLADEVMAGKHGNGDARKRSLGANYADVQTEVNRRARVVTTVTELDALLVGSVVLDRHGEAWRKTRTGDWTATALGITTSSGVPLPARVLYEGDGQ